MAEGKKYPGQLEEYHNLRALREQAQSDAGDAPSIEQAQLIATLANAEQLAGLSYIADGIRYNTRRKG